jgi:hypothetical protein
MIIIINNVNNSISSRIKICFMTAKGLLVDIKGIMQIELRFLYEGVAYLFNEQLNIIRNILDIAEQINLSLF